MSIILVIDNNPEEITKELSGFKGVTYFKCKNIADSIKLLPKEQFDYILCDYDIAKSYNESTKNNFREDSMKIQTNGEFFYVLAEDTGEKSKSDKSEMFEAHGVIRQPMGYHIMQVIMGSNLIDQSDIDKLFHKIKKA